MKSKLIGLLIGLSLISMIFLDTATYSQAETASSMTADKVTCDPGFFLKGRVACTKTEPKNYSPTGTRVTCPAGSMCPHKGMTVPTPCPAGSYQDRSGQDQCFLVVQGFFAPNEGTANALTCTPGSVCPGRGTVTPIKCAPGTYSGSTRLKSGQCMNVQSGTYTPNSINKLVCPAGHYCPGSNTVTPLLCGVGTYAGAGASECSECGLNSMQGATGQSSCTACPSGYGGSNYLGVYVADKFVASGAARCLYQCERNDTTRNTCKG